MDGFKLTFSPGWQQGHDTVEYSITEIECVRSVTDYSKRRPTSFYSVSREKEKVQRILKRLNEIDWGEVVESADKLIVDDADIYCVEGYFGKVSAPFLFGFVDDFFTKEFQRQCKSIVKIFDDLTRLPFDDVPNGC